MLEGAKLMGAGAATTNFNSFILQKIPMSFLVGPAQPAISVFLNGESKNKSLFFFGGEQSSQRMNQRK
jgi:hypothetical protein